MYAGMQVYRYTGMQAGTPGLHVCRYAGMQVCTYATMQGGRNAGSHTPTTGYREYSLSHIILAVDDIQSYTYYRI